MKTNPRFAALVAVLSLTFWLGNRPALAARPCESTHGAICSMYGPLTSDCGSGGFCICDGAHWDCGCSYDDVGTLLCPGGG